MRKAFIFSESMTLYVDLEKKAVEIQHDKPAGRIPVRYIGFIRDRKLIAELVETLKKIL